MEQGVDGLDQCWLHGEQGPVGSRAHVPPPVEAGRTGRLYRRGHKRAKRKETQVVRDYELGIVTVDILPGWKKVTSVAYVPSCECSQVLYPTVGIRNRIRKYFSYIFGQWFVLRTNHPHCSRTPRTGPGIILV